jgi:hypothetical protein
MARKIDPLKAKQKKQKIVAGCLSAVLVAVLAYEVPNLMKHFNQKAPAGSVTGTSTTAAPPSGTPSLAAPTLAGSSQSGTATTAVSSDGVTSGDVAPTAQDGQLASFSRFVSKDPFAQQIQDSTSGSSASGSPSSGSSTPSGPTSTGRSTSTGSSGTPSGRAPAPGSAVISVNGTLMTVTVGGDFPATQPLFHLVSLTAHTARIAIVGGSYANGAAAVTLHENKPLTLMNTADGTRYRIILKPQGMPVPSASSTTPTSTTPSSTTTTSPSP